MYSARRGDGDAATSGGAPRDGSGGPRGMLGSLRLEVNGPMMPTASFLCVILERPRNTKCTGLGASLHLSNVIGIRGLRTESHPLFAAPERRYVVLLFTVPRATRTLATDHV